MLQQCCHASDFNLVLLRVLRYRGGTNGNAVNFRGLISLSLKLLNDVESEAHGASRSTQSGGDYWRALDLGIKGSGLVSPLAPMCVPLGKSFPRSQLVLSSVKCGEYPLPCLCLEGLCRLLCVRLRPGQC